MSIKSTLAGRLNQVTLDGIQFLGAVRLMDNDRTLGRVLTLATYGALLPEGSSPSLLAARFTGPESLGVLRAPTRQAGRTRSGLTPGIGRRVDVRRSLALGGSALCRGRSPARRDLGLAI